MARLDSVAALAVLFLIAGFAPACSGRSPVGPTPQTPSSADLTIPPPVSAPPPAGPRFTAQEHSEMLEALLLKEGPMADTSATPSCVKGVLRGWSEDVPDVEIVFSPRVSATTREAILQPAAQFTEITGGRIRFTARTADLPSYPTYASVAERPRIGQIFVQIVDDIRTFCGGSSACSGHQLSAGPNRAGSAYVALGPDGWGAAHEMGHMLIRACHVAPGTLVWQNSVMGAQGNASRFTEWEFQAVKEVYGKGLLPGATRADFVRVGLVN